MPDKKQIGGSHYTDMKVQPWDAMQSCSTKEEFIAHLRLTALKYVMRAGHKDPFQQDIEKAIHYLEKILDVISATKP